MERKLKLFVDPSWKRDGIHHIPLMHPFWGNPISREKTPFQWQLFERHQFDNSYYELVNQIEEADMVFMPYSHNHATLFAPDVLAHCIEVSQKSGKPLLIDGVGDIERPIEIPNSYVIRYGGYRFEKHDHEIHIPPYADDLLAVYRAGELEVRHKSEKPSISFAGWGRLTFVQSLRAVLKELPDRVHSIVDSRYGAKKKGVFFRTAAVRILKESREVVANFLVRRSYSGNAHTAEKSQDELRREFVDNLLGSDYALDVRGDANASIRLFEILSLGRIPVIVDTERNLPFSDVVDYSKFSLIVDFRKLSSLPHIVAEFNRSLTDEQFIAMQKAAYEAFTEHFRVDKLMAHIVRELRLKGAFRDES